MLFLIICLSSSNLRNSPSMNRIVVPILALLIYLLLLSTQLITYTFQLSRSGSHFRGSDMHHQPKRNLVSQVMLLVRVKRPLHRPLPSMGLNRFERSGFCKKLCSRGRICVVLIDRVQPNTFPLACGSVLVLNSLGLGGFSDLAQVLSE